MTAEGVQYGSFDERTGLAAGASGLIWGNGGIAGEEPAVDKGAKHFADVPSPGALASTRLGMTVGEQWPSFKLVGFGFYYAWIWISYNSDVLVYPTVASVLPPDSISATYLASTLALALSLIALSLMGNVAKRLVSSTAFLVGVSVLVGLATVGTYLSSGLEPLGASPWSVLSGILTGIGTSFVVLRFGVIYSKASARDAVMYAAASFVFAGMIYFVAVGLPDPLSTGFTATLPCLAVLSTLTNSEWSSMEAPKRPPIDGRLRSFFVRLVVAVVVFSLVVGVARGFSMPSSSLALLNDEGSLIVFSTTTVAAVLFAVLGLTGRRFDVSRIYYPIIIAVSAAILVTPLFGGSTFGAQFVTVGYNCFILVIWCLLAYVAYSSHLSPILVFGLGRGASALGTTLGWTGGLQIVQTQGDGSLSLEVIAVAMVFALLIVSMLVLNDRMIGETLRSFGSAPAGDGEGAAAGSAAQGTELPRLEESAAAGEPGAGSTAAPELSAGSEGEAAVAPDEERRPGAYRLRCNAVADKYDLSPRERDVFDLLVRGRSIEYIAQSLTISFNTAKSHIRHIYVKTDVHSRQELLDLIDAETAE
ncbi:MAG: LuxR family transcriptional regulator [Eggerthellaceae bacterium]|nr:LuxR family transcriptional regulator [Eggerthellaceae bacterium]